MSFLAFTGHFASEFVVLLMKHFLPILCLFFFLSWLNYVPHITAQKAEDSHPFVFRGSALTCLAGWRIFLQKMQSDRIFFSLQGAFYRVSFLSLLSAPQQSAVFTRFLCCPSAVTPTWQGCSALLVFASRTCVVHWFGICILVEILSFYAVSQPSRGNVLSLDPLKKKQGKDLLILIFLSWKKKMQDSHWKVHMYI